VILAAGRARRYGGLKPLAPVGPGGEAILDLVASDALSAGFGTIVLVIGTETGPTIRDHVGRHWPGGVDVRFALQATPTGTVGAVVAGWSEVAGHPRFGVANADDLYGPAALSILATHLAGTDEDNALVGFRLDRAVVGTLPVTRGVCRTDDDGYLVQIDERRGVVPRDDGTFGTGDGRTPEVLDPDTLVSLNLWAFSSALRREFETAMESGREDEVLLPDLVGQLIAAPHGAHRFLVLPTDSRCIGVTHPDDLAVVQHDVAAQVDRGERPASLWS
jgi:NDP-sugar pyrophosphorylase family protein